MKLTSQLTLTFFLACSTLLVAAPQKAKSSETKSTAFDKFVDMGKIGFRVQCPNNSSLNKVTITPKGLTGSNKVIVAEADGTVTDVQIADINNDGFPEIYISVTSAGSGSYGTLIAYACNKGKSVSEIFLPELTKKQLKGYMGHDEFAPVDMGLIRNFPVYKNTDKNAKATGKTRQIQYKLNQGETGWKLVASKTFDY